MERVFCLSSSNAKLEKIATPDKKITQKLSSALCLSCCRWMNNTGDTVATVMGWLSSTQAGGATTFHNGVDLVRLWPTRGAAGVWYSLYTDGSKVTGYRGNIKTSRK